MTEDLLGTETEQKDAAPGTPGRKQTKRKAKPAALPWKKAGIYRAPFRFQPGTEILAGVQYFGPSGDERWKFVHCRSDIDGNPRFVDVDGNIYPWRHITCYTMPEEIIPDLETLE